MNLKDEPPLDASENKEWTLDSLGDDAPYLPERKPFVSDYIVKSGLLLLLILALTAIFSNRF